MKKNYLHAYAIVRYETQRDESIAIDHRITVKKIVFNPDYAAAEVNRLNGLNADKGAYYFWQITRIEQPFPMPARRRDGRPPNWMKRRNSIKLQPRADSLHGKLENSWPIRRPGLNQPAFEGRP